MHIGGINAACKGDSLMRHDAPADGGDAPGGIEGDVREQSILDAALSMFLERGYEGTSLARIASAARLTPAEVHRRFGSKADLLGVLLDRELEAARAPFAQGVPSFATALDAARFLAQQHRAILETSALPALTRIAIDNMASDKDLVGLFETTDGREQGQAFGEHVLRVLIERGLFRQRCASFWA